MTSVETIVQGHYGSGGVLDRILAAAQQAGADPERLTPEDLYRFDQLHAGGAAATKNHLEKSGIRPGMHVLDLGCGIGGSSRYIAAHVGCRVTAVDLTPEFVAVARELTRRCGLANIEFREANALALPFADATFDHVWSHAVTMNIADKTGFAAEVARVLKPGGRFSCAEAGQGPAGGALSYPVAWAQNASSSFLVTPAAMRAALEAAGLRIVEQIDLTETNRAMARQERERVERGEPPSNNPGVVMGEAFAERSRNAAKNAAENRTVEHLIVAQR